ncbi:hypothetical protein [Deferribacter abyssi]|uniref:hypothetical protein n=1 Tax=Deferribacter abyssi TaxID=213806 RepID=UPI003C20387D
MVKVEYQKSEHPVKIEKIEFEDVAVKNILNFLNKLGLRLKIYYKPHSLYETYEVSNEKNKIIFIGNYRSFFRWLVSISEIYQKLFVEELYYEVLKESGRLN